MSDYSKATNFTTKDTLPTGNAGKIVKGTELDTEFVAIASAIASKADVSSPALLGTPTSPTATAGSNTTQIANTAYVKTAVDNLGTIGTMAAQNKTSVDITGGTIVGITDLVVADGGTGRSTLTDKAVLIGAGTGAINSVAPSTSGNVLTSDGTNWNSTAPVAPVKAWVNFDGTQSGTITPRASLNIASVVKNATGDYTITFTTALTDANYVVSGSASSTGGGSSYANAVVTLASGTAQTSSAFRVYTGYTGAASSNGANQDSTYVHLIIIR
jgi:hypothetical protein